MKDIYIYNFIYFIDFQAKKDAILKLKTGFNIKKNYI